MLTILLITIWRIYWLVTERHADREKPKTREKPSFFSQEYGKRFMLFFFGMLFLLQAFFNIARFPLPYYSATPFIGFLLAVVGFVICIVARRELATNWANAWEYQIKQNHELVTSGIYGLIRHPIYTGIIVGVVGCELVVNSSLFLPALLIGVWIVYNQAKKEEKLLEKHFGKAYTDYKKRSKMLIPFIW